MNSGWWKRSLSGAVLVVCVCAAAAAQQNQWTVKSAWVRAHEEFLASDVMAGRGSATRDEQIAATYIASEFLGYGLKPAPGMSTMIQAADVVAPQLDGRARLTVGDIKLDEGKDFTLLIASGEDAQGPAHVVPAADLKQPAFAKGAIVLAGNLPAGVSAMQAAQGLFRAGASTVVTVKDAATAQFQDGFGGKTRIRMRLKEDAGAAKLNLIAVSQPTMNLLLAQPTDSAVRLEVKPIPEAGPSRQTFNAIGYLAGSDPASGTILLSAHLDHLGIGKPVNGDAIYNGANDDASGTTAVLELAHALAAGPRLRRNVLFVCYGSEEAGELGSIYFGQHPPVPLASLVANLEFEMIGAQDPKMPPGVLLLTGWERSNLGPTLKAHGALLGPDPYAEQHFFERSDNYALALKGVVAHTAAGYGTVPTYHQPDDDLAHLDLPFMTRAIQSLVEPVRWLATSNFKPHWDPGGQPKP